MRADLRLYALGYAPEAHAAKLPPWTLRLRTARQGLDTAVRRRDRSEVLRNLEDLWFWIGRLTGEAMAAAADPRHAQQAAAAGVELQAAHQVVYRARALLLSRPRRVGL